MPKFNPEENYVWKSDDEFPLMGGELEFMHNSLSTICNTDIKPAQMYIMIYEMLKVTSDILKRNVESGKIKADKKEKGAE